MTAELEKRETLVQAGDEFDRSRERRESVRELRLPFSILHKARINSSQVQGAPDGWYTATVVKSVRWSRGGKRGDGLCETDGRNPTDVNQHEPHVFVAPRSTADISMARDRELERQILLLLSFSSLDLDCHLSIIALKVTNSVQS